MADSDQFSKRPPDTAFQQQRLKAWQPLLTPTYVIITFFAIGCFFLPIGVIILSASNSVFEMEKEYSGSGPQTLEFVVTEDVTPPLFLYYKLENFYQNHRRYVKSRSESQLRGVDGPTSGCDPLEKSGALSLYPCGLVANSMFNDVITGTVTQGSNTTALNRVTNSSQSCTGEYCWFETDISWESDRQKKFKEFNPPKAITPSPLTGTAIPSVTDEHFIVWMRTAGLPTFKKLYARLPEITLQKGDTLTINVNSSFEMASFGGKKYIVISTTSWLGGKNIFLGFVYIVVGLSCVILGLIFLIKHKLSPRPLGSMAYFNWPGSNQS